MHIRRFRIRDGLWLFFWAIILVLPAQSAELKYNGKSLREWLSLYQKAENNSAAEQRAAAAVRTIGASALPQLIKWAASDDLYNQFLAESGFQILGAAAQSADGELG